MKVILTEEQLKHIFEVSTQSINAEAKNVNTNPTDPQKDAGNYRMGHISIKGMKISIENPVGSKRKFKKEDGSEGYVIMRNHYGYFGGTSGNGKDGDAVDVFIGPNPEGFERVYVIDQNKQDGSFDESKVMLGFDSREQAKEAYMSNYNPGWTGFRSITGVSLRLFKKWLYRGNKQRKPFAEYVEIQKRKLEESLLKEGYSYHDRLELIRDPNIKDGGNFGIRRNGKEYWVSRSNCISLYVYCKDERGVWNILASKRGSGPNIKSPNRWNVVNGFLDYGYSLEDTAVKECEEETGVIISKEMLKNQGTYSSRVNGPVVTRFVCFLDGTTAEHPTDISGAEPNEVTCAKWIPIDEVDKYFWLNGQGQSAAEKLKELLGYKESQNADFKQIVLLLQKLFKENVISADKYKQIMDILIQ